MLDATQLLIAESASGRLKSLLMGVGGIALVAAGVGVLILVWMGLAKVGEVVRDYDSFFYGAVVVGGVVGYVLVGGMAVLGAVVALCVVWGLDVLGG